MAVTESTLEFFGLDWGTWVRDCSVPFSRVDFPDTVDFSIEVDATGLSDAVKTVASFLGDKQLSSAVSKLKKILPQGKAAFRVVIAPTADATPCQGEPPTATVSASIVLVILFSAEVTVSGTKTTVDMRIREHIDSHIEKCDCKPVDKKTGAVPAGQLESATGELVARLPLSGLVPRVVEANVAKTDLPAPAEGVIVRSSEKIS